MKGYMWKKGQKADDSDVKKTIKRLFFHNESYKRRYFMLDSVKLELKYYTDYSKRDELGCIDLLTIVSVSYDCSNSEELPSKYPICLSTPQRDWELCCENENDFAMWKKAIDDILKRRERGSSSDAIVSKKKRRNMSLTTSPLENFERTVMDEADFKNLVIHRQDSGGKAGPRKSSTKAKLSFLKRRSNVPHVDSFRKDILFMQSSRLDEESVYNKYTGNVGIAATSVFSRYDTMEKLEFFQVLMSSCDDHLDISTRQDLVTKFLSGCQFQFFTKEGETLITEGNKFEWVYFVVAGEIEQRKTWASSPNHMDEKISAGQCAGFIEVLHFNSVSTTTLLVGPGTVCLKMNVTAFKQQFSSNIKGSGIFSTSMDPSCTLYLERLRTFAFKRLSNIPLLERQPTSNIQELSHIFSPVSVARGEPLLTENDSSKSFYIIIQGSCSVFQNSSLDTEEVDEIVRSCRGGDWLGEAGLLNVRSKLTAAVAYSDVVALRTDAAGFKRFLDIVGPRVRDIITQSTTTYLKSTLKNIPLFANIDEITIEDISRNIEVEEYERDTLLYDANDKIEHLHVILHGHIKCSISFLSGLDLSNSPPIIDTMRENDFFGENSVLYDSTPSAMLYFTPKDVKVVVLSIPAKKLKPYLVACPILQLRFEERLLVRRNHMDLIDTLVNSISDALTARYEARGNSTTRTKSKSSLGHMADVKAKESENLMEELQYLRDEVKKLGGTQYSVAAKARKSSKNMSAFKSTMKLLKSTLPMSNPKSPRRGHNHKEVQYRQRNFPSESDYGSMAKTFDHDHSE